MKFLLQKRTIKVAICILMLFIVVGIFAPLGEHAAYAAEEQTTTEAIVDGTLGRGFAWISENIFKLSGALLAAGGYLMDLSITYSLDINNFAKGAVENGWTILRDVANITFIFILLYVAIGTILQIGNINTKQALVNVIIIAFLINFSLFFTQVIIDASNYLATFFYNNAVKITVDGAQSNLGQIFTAALGPNSLFGKDIFTSLTNTKAGVSFLIASVAVLLAAFSFFSVAIMFIIRTAALVLLMVLSPVAFAAYILSDTKKYFSQWFDTLLKQAFFAPIYLLVIYVVLLIIVASPFHASKQAPLAAAINEFAIPFESEPGTLTTAGAEDVITAPLGTPPDFTLASQNLAQVPRQTSFGAEDFQPPGAGTLASSGSLSYLSVFFSYFLIIFLINGALVVAKQLGGQTASLGTKWAGKGLGAAMGLGGAIGRRTAGAGFAWLSQRKGLKDAAAESGPGGFAARLALRGAEKGARATYDFRGGRVGTALGAGAGVIGADFGSAGGRGGFREIEKRAKERDVELAKTLGRGPGGAERLGSLEKTLEKGSIFSTMAGTRGAEMQALEEVRKMRIRKQMPELNQKKKESERRISALREQIKTGAPATDDLRRSIEERESKIAALQAKAVREQELIPGEKEKIEENISVLRQELEAKRAEIKASQDISKTQAEAKIQEEEAKIDEIDRQISGIQSEDIAGKIAEQIKGSGFTGGGGSAPAKEK